jgi:hypothetical protein
MNDEFEIKGGKLVELPYLEKELSNQTKTDSILIVGEHVATEGVLQTVLKRDFSECICTDIQAVGKGSTLEKIIERDSRVSFIQQDFVEAAEDKKYDYIVCINVLEHFGMNFEKFHGFSGALAGDDYIRWNHDLRAIQKMVALLNDNPDAKIIVTVPGGQPVLTGDINPGNRMPFLRRYDILRINLIEEMLDSMKVSLSSTFYYSENFVEWFQGDISITSPYYAHANNAFSPNMIWAFTIKK